MIIKIPGLFLFLLMYFYDPEPAVACDITKISALAVDRSDNDALARMALHHLAVARSVLII